MLGLAAILQFFKHNFISKKTNLSGSSSSETLGLLITQSSIFYFFFFLGSWWGYFAYWILPLLTFAKTLAHFRNVAEHVLLSSVPAKQSLGRLRTIKSNFFEEFFFSPLGFNYHAEHHMFPGVPYHQLALLSSRLIDQDYYKTNIDYYRGGYCSLLIKHVLKAK